MKTCVDDILGQFTCVINLAHEETPQLEQPAHQHVPSL